MRCAATLPCLLVLACASDHTPADSGGAARDASSAPADAAPDRDAATDRDATANRDAELDGDAGPNPDATPDRDALTGDAGPIAALPDERCAYPERLGTLTISDSGGAGPRYLDLRVDDAPPPWLGPPTLTDAACQFHQTTPHPGCSCARDQVCDFQGQCARAPVPVAGLRVDVMAGAQVESFSGDGAVAGPITLVDAALAFRVTTGAWVIDVPPLSIPEPLLGKTGVLTGDYDRPEAIDLSWTPSTSGAHVSTLININHHVSNGTFTECVVPADRGAMHIDGAMLLPLAVSTGLEFQGISHVRYARASVPGGCFEVRLLRMDFLSL